MSELSEVRTNSSELLYPFLNGVGNHEAKTLLASIILSQPEAWFLNNDMLRELNDRQGSEPAWRMQAKRPLEYCGNSLEPVGLVVKGAGSDVRGKEVVAYKAKEDVIEEALALSGAALTWSLKHSDYSVQQLLGSTQSKSDQRSPETRFKIFSVLNDATEPTTLLNVTKLIYGDGSRHSYIRGQIKLLGHAGLVDVDVPKQRYNPELEIVGTEFTHPIKELSDLAPESKAIYEVVGTLAIGDKLSLDELIDKAVEQASTIDPKIARRKLVVGLSDGRGFTIIKRIGEGMPNYVWAKVGLPDAVRAASTTLIPELDSATKRPNFQRYGRAALQIISHPESVYALMEKARKFSSAAAAQEQGTERYANVLAVVSHKGEVTADELMVELNERYGRRYAIDSVRTLARELMSLGQLRVRKEEVHGHKSAQKTKYTLPQ